MVAAGLCGKRLHSIMSRMSPDLIWTEKGENQVHWDREDLSSFGQIVGMRGGRSKARGTDSAVSSNRFKSKPLL